MPLRKIIFLRITTPIFLFFTRGVGLLQIQTLNEIVTSRSASLAGLHAQLTSLSCALTRGDAECRSLRVARTALQMR